MIEVSIYSRSNCHLCEVALGVLEGLQKESIEIPHPDGKISIKYPEVFDTSTPMRVRGKGFRRERVGDMYVKNIVKFKRG